LRLIVVRKHQRQVGDAHEAVLTREGQLLIAALLLGEFRDPMLAGVIDADLPALLNRKSARARKAGVSHIILGAGCGRATQFRGPPLASRSRSRDEPTDSPVVALALRRKAPGFGLS
jgi:hypothetical protein